MSLTNTENGYGAFTKLFQWLVVLLFALQYAAGHIMTRIGGGDVVLGLTQGDYYDWHKSLGLVALAVAILRLINRRAGQLPAWAPALSEGERNGLLRRMLPKRTT
jgi:cytochrome b561